jgi:hypothetical protein
MPILLLFSILFLLLTVSPREGLRNGTHTSGVQPEVFYTKLITPNEDLYDVKYKDYLKSDVILDFMYFNNASKILSELRLGKN